jgi:PAP2 superfamily
MADGFIAGFESKYHFNYWRPVTAIRAGGDREWLSYLPTPPVPDYPSTHTVLGAAAATVMARFFNTDFISFLDDERCPYPNITRKFWSFSEAARESIPSPLRDSLLERGERRLYPGQTHWGLGLRTRVETCEP